MQPQPTILVVEDQPSEREALARMLRMAQYNVLGAASLDEAMTMADEHIDLVVSDLRLGPHTGLEVLRQWKQRRPETPFILVTAYGDVASAVEAMKLGAADYLTKPVNPDELLSLIEKWLKSAAQEPFGYDTPHDGGIDIPPGTSLEDLERAAVEKALEEHHGNRTRAARTLGISVRTLQRKLKAWRMPLFALERASH
jgi:DNA-binding NtrC family response regulator